MARAKKCPDCDCPMLPPRTGKKPDHYDHASGCRRSGTNPCSDCRKFTAAGPCPGCGVVVCQLCAERDGEFCCEDQAMDHWVLNA
jgi:hypothetical protein